MSIGYDPQQVATRVRKGRRRELLAEHGDGGFVGVSFLGSGSTLLAAERVGRVCFGIDIDPLYIDLSIRRWERSTGGRMSACD